MIKFPIFHTAFISYRERAFTPGARFIMETGHRMDSLPAQEYEIKFPFEVIWFNTYYNTLPLDINKPAITLNHGIFEKIFIPDFIT